MVPNEAAGGSFVPAAPKAEIEGLWQQAGRRRSRSALPSTLRKLRAAGFISRQALADELNRQKNTDGPWRKMAIHHCVKIADAAGAADIRQGRQDQQWPGQQTCR